MSAVEILRVEAKMVQDRCLLAAERCYAAEGPWYHLNYWLGIPSVTLAAVAGATGLSQLTNSGIVAGVISLVVAVLTSLLTFLDPIKKADTFHRFAKEYEKLYNEVGFFLRVTLRVETTTIEDAQAALEGFAATFSDLNRNSPAISLAAQRRADANLANNTGEVVIVRDVPQAQ